ncbi:MAG TPA: hypothetical protein VF194_08145 [Ferrovibrio sp.]|uniref:hypothetical protein n=1 Tax=Ferrovibrio sp. TaxID=1917215 RepID=UPI002ED45F7A
MLTALVLVCSLAATPDLSACNRQTAIDVMRVPEEFSHPGLCAMRGQAYVAQTAIGRGLREDESVKVVCVPSSGRSVSSIRNMQRR